MNQNKVNGIGIVLVIVGLLVGAGGGYFFVSNNKAPILAELTAEDASLIASIAEADTTIAGLEETVSELEGDVDQLDDSIQDMQIEVNSKDNEINSLEHNIEVYEDKISELEPRIEKQTGYEIFSVYDLWFQYPSGMSFSFDVMLEEDFSDKYGSLEGELERTTRDESLIFRWQYVDFVPDIEGDVIGLAQSYADNMKDGYDLDSTFSEMATVEVDGHTFYYQTVAPIYKGDELVRVTYGGWYCNINNLAYRFIYLNSNPNSQDRYMETIQTIFCH